MLSWPSPNDYTVAIQSPHQCFRDPELKVATVERLRLTGMPKVWTGNFAQVYELKNSTRRWAVKCFTRSSADLTLRYSELSKAIATSKLPYFVDFRFLTEEILVNAKRYPVVRMQWIDGQTLDKYVEANLSRPQALLSIASGLLNMVRDMEERQLAHGDLQHGNVVITASGLKLVDYDGMFVPAFAGKPAPETGLSSYQHPRRGPADYGVGLDRFALLVICTGLCALAVEPNLWYDFSTGENFLFTSNDFKDQKGSRIFRRLSTFSDKRVCTFTELLKVACVENPLFAPIPSATALQDGPATRPWWWVASQTPALKQFEAHPSPHRLSQRIAEFHHVGAATLILIGILVLASEGFLGGEWAAVMSVVGVLVYLLERINRYNSLPALLRQRDLQSKLTQLRRDLDDQNVKKRAVEQQMLTLTQQTTRKR